MKILVWAWLRALDKYSPCKYEYDDIDKNFFGTREYKTDDMATIMYLKIVYGLIYRQGCICHDHRRVFAGRGQ